MVGPVLIIHEMVGDEVRGAIPIFPGMLNFVEEFFKIIEFSIKWVLIIRVDWESSIDLETEAVEGVVHND